MKIAIVGSSGRMGQEILRLASEQGLAIVAGVGTKTADLVPATFVSHVKELSPAQFDVVIDFSQPRLTAEVARWCAANKKALVCGTTGIDAVVKAELGKASKEVAVLWAPNMSLGVAIMAKMFQSWASLEDFEFQIEELHHKHKKDAPSGTAIFLQQKLIEAVGKPVPEPLAIRGGGIFGIHRAWAMGEEETITVEHTAMNRRVFARGALRAARWIASQKPGLYAMADVFA